MEQNIFKSRSQERMVALILAGLSMILGFLLFIIMPDLSDAGSGDVELLKMKIKLANVAPGIFFALFGSVVIIYSIATQVKFKEIVKKNDASITEKEIRYVQTSLNENLEAKNLQGLYLRDFRIFTEVTEKINNSEVISEALRFDLENSLTNTKEALMRSVWTEEWGDYSKFKDWIAKGYPEPIPVEIKKAAEFFSGK